VALAIEQCRDLGVEVHGIDIRGVENSTAASLVDLVHQHKLVVIRDQLDFSESEFVGFARALGTPQIYFQHNYHHPEYPEIFVSSNIVDDRGRRLGVSGTGRYWHTDCAFQADPLSMTMVTPRIIPKLSRGTLYIDMAAVLERLPEHLAKFAREHHATHEAKWRYKIQAQDIDKSVTEVLAEFEKISPPATHPMVIEHPVTHREILYVSDGFTTGIVGFSYEEGKRILAEFFRFIERDEHVVAKQWKQGDILLWDNRYLLHKAAHGDPTQKNMSYRIGVYDQQPFYCA